MKKLTIIVIFSVLINISCTEECLLALADLSTSILIEVDNVNAGEIFTFSNLIKNVKDVTTSCQTASVGQTSTKMDVSYRKNVNENFQDLITDNFFIVPPIGENQNALENYDVEFSTSGHYKIVMYADGKFQEEERLEINNESNITGEGRNTSSNGEFIVVVNRSLNESIEPKMLILKRTVIVR